MPIPLGHFAVGAGGALAALTASGDYARTDHPTEVVLLSGVWATLPDLGHLLSSVPPLDRTPLADLFWLHYTLDTHTVSDSWWGSTILVVSLAGVVVASLAAGHTSE